MNRADFLRTGAALLASAALPATAGPAMPAETMQTRPIPSTSARLPVVGCGTWQGFDVGTDPADRARLREVLQVLLDHGGSVIDSSPMYGRAEAVVGDLLVTMKARERAFVATKVWTRGQQAGVAQMQRSLQLLHADPIDLMQVHNLLDWREHLATLRAWKAEGRVRYIGVTHYTSSAYPELESILKSERLDFVQLNYALDDRDAERRLLPLAAERGIAVIVNMPFGGGGLLRSLSGKPLPAWAAELDCRSWAEILLKFVLGHPAVTCVIPGTGKPEHMRANARAGFGAYPDAALRKTMIASLSR